MRALNGLIAYMNMPKILFLFGPSMRVSLCSRQRLRSWMPLPLPLGSMILEKFSTRFLHFQASSLAAFLAICRKFKPT